MAVPEGGVGEGALSAAAARSEWPPRDAQKPVPGAWRPEASGGAELDVDADVVWQATHKEVRLLLRRQLRRVAHHGVEVLLVILDGTVPGEPCQL